jgi:hypothetical protein
LRQLPPGHDPALPEHHDNRTPCDPDRIAGATPGQPSSVTALAQLRAAPGGFACPPDGFYKSYDFTGALWHLVELFWHNLKLMTPFGSKNGGTDGSVSASFCGAAGSASGLLCRQHRLGT